MGKGSHGSILSGNYAPIRLSSGWKSTTSTQAEHTQAQLALRNEQNQIARDVQDICEAQGNW
ncbi:hypothetical protein E2978_00265 (plasmid) [Paracoccus yeei]